MGADGVRGGGGDGVGGGRVLVAADHHPLLPILPLLLLILPLLPLPPPPPPPPRRRHSSDSDCIPAGPAQKVSKSAPESLKKH